MEKISEYKLLNWFLETKRDYQIGRNYIGFAWDVVQLVLLVSIKFNISGIYIALFGVFALIGVIIFGKVLRVKNIPQRENSLGTQLSPPMMKMLENDDEVLERLERIEKNQGK